MSVFSLIACVGRLRPYSPTLEGVGFYYRIGPYPIAADKTADRLCVTTS